MNEFECYDHFKFTISNNSIHCVLYLFINNAVIIKLPVSDASNSTTRITSTAITLVGRIDGDDDKTSALVDDDA